MGMGRMPGGRQEELFIAASAVRALDNPFYTALRRVRGGGVPGVLRGADGPAGPSSGRVLPDADGGLPRGDRLGAGHRVAVQGLGLAAGVSGLRSGEDAVGAFDAVEDAQAAELGGARDRVRLGAGTRLKESGLLKGKTMGVDSTTLEANAVMRAIVRCDDGTEYDAGLEELAERRCCGQAGGPGRGASQWRGELGAAHPPAAGG